MQNAFTFHTRGSPFPSVLNAFCIQDLRRRFEPIPQLTCLRNRILGPCPCFLLFDARDDRNNWEAFADGSRSLISAIRVISRNSG
jgi:hypothetical protein